MQIFIDSSCNILYSSFYLYGLKELYGKNIRFSSKKFKSLNYSSEVLALIVKTDNSTTNVIIDFGNSNKIDFSALQWCNVYGKVNLDPKDQYVEKIVSLGPLTAVKLFSRRETIWYALSNLVKSYSKITNVRTFLANYKAQLSRPHYTDYNESNPQSNYVFFASSLWKKEPQANQHRANFIQACKEYNGLNFEGGFAPRSKNDIHGYESLSMKLRVSFDEFSQKTINSEFVFNTPTVAGCNGWRLAEYLLMGKTIISTPLLRMLPEKLVDGEHVLYVSGSIESINSAIDKLLKNPKLKTTLGSNAKTYFQQQLTPTYVIKRLLKNIS